MCGLRSAAWRAPRRSAGMSAAARVFSGARIAMYESVLAISCSSMSHGFSISSIGATRVNVPPAESKLSRTRARAPRRASSRATSSISGRPGGWERMLTCHPGCGSTQSTRTRAYAWIRGSTRAEAMCSRGSESRRRCSSLRHDPEPGADDRVGRAGARRMAGHGREELVAAEGMEQDVGLGDDGRRARHVPEQGDLAEALPGAELADARAADRHREPSELDHVEAV